MEITTIPTMCWSVAANPSPLGVKLHDAGYKECGLDFKYVALGSDDIGGVIDLVRRIGVRGLGVSMPHKVAVLEHLNSVEPDVRTIGACNTVVNDSGILTGHNTDWIGAQGALDEAGLGNCETALIVGAGGVARAIAYALSQRGTHVTVAARDLAKARALADEFGLEGATTIDRQADVAAELLVNATPDSGAVVLEESRLPRGVFDVVFQTRNTLLTNLGTQHRLAVVPGWRMLLLQAAAQFQLYTRTEPPVSSMAAVLEAALPES